MSIAGATPVTIPINFSSLRSLFSGPTQTTSLHISQWKSFVSYVNLPSYYVGCQIQGINIGKWGRTSHSLRWGLVGSWTFARLQPPVQTPTQARPNGAVSPHV